MISPSKMQAHRSLPPQTPLALHRWSQPIGRGGQRNGLNSYKMSFQCFSMLKPDFVCFVYVAHVMPTPENLDSQEAASFLRAVRISCSRLHATAFIDNRLHRVSRYIAR
jgi:hypothetical protein